MQIQVCNDGLQVYYCTITLTKDLDDTRPIAADDASKRQVYQTQGGDGIVVIS